MTIETKYNIGDKVWYLDTESEPMPKIKELMIDKIIIHIQDKKTYIAYNCYFFEIWDLVPTNLKEEHIYKTKEELIASL